jgi:glyoxylase-like metal-dependent hydrolase (beta-lactamase superfamily II)
LWGTARRWLSIPALDRPTALPSHVLSLKLARGNQKLFLTTTHFHPEHAAGEAGFSRGTILIRDSVQQQEMELHGKEMVDMFANRSAQWKELLAKATLRTPDITFDTEAKIDLGGVTARLLWFGGAHTKGDELTFVEPDRTLISGDVVQNKVVPNIFGDGGTPSSWLTVLDKVAALNALHVLPITALQATARWLRPRKSSSVICGTARWSLRRRVSRWMMPPNSSRLSSK